MPSCLYISLFSPRIIPQVRCQFVFAPVGDSAQRQYAGLANPLIRVPESVLHGGEQGRQDVGCAKHSREGIEGGSGALAQRPLIVVVKVVVGVYLVRIVSFL
jgi:hypothetical protein